MLATAAKQLPSAGALHPPERQPPRTIVLVKSVDQRAHAVVPQLDHAAVQRRQDPWPLGVEAQPLDAVGLQVQAGESRGMHMCRDNHCTNGRDRNVQTRSEAI